MYLLDGGGSIMQTTTTAADGTYEFTGLPAGAFAVEIALPAGMILTTGSNPSPVPLSSGEVFLTADFGLIGTGAIGQVIWHDVDADGEQDASESGTPNVSVTLEWAGLDGVLGTGDDVSFDTVTDSDGVYLFGALPAGLYRVTVDGDTLPAGFRLTYTPDGGDDLVDTLVLAAGATVTTENFGFVLQTELPFTGLSTQHLSVIALLFLVLGAALVTASRRKEDPATAATGRTAIGERAPQPRRPLPVLTFASTQPFRPPLRTQAHRWHWAEPDWRPRRSLPPGPNQKPAHHRS